MGDSESGNIGKAQYATTSQPADQSPSVGKSGRYVQKTQEYLEQALDAESSRDKNYHIRNALQLLEFEQSDCLD